MAFGLTADWDAVKDLDVLGPRHRAAIDELAAAGRAFPVSQALALGVPVGHLGQPAAGRLELGA